MSDESNPMEGPALGGRSLKDPKQPPVKPNVRLYWLLYIGCMLAYSVFVVPAILNWNTILFEAGWLKFNLGLLFLLPVAVHLAFSLKQVDTHEVAGKYFYGVPLFRALPGLNFVPAGLMNLERYPADIQEIFLPGKPDSVFWGDEKEPLPSGMVRPIWVPTRPPTDVEKNPLDAQLVVGIVGYAFWRVTDIFTFHARVTSIGEADSQLRSIWTRVASEDIVRYTASGAIEHQQVLNANLDDNIRDHTGDWGIQVTSAGLTKINVSHTLGAAMRDRAKARFELETKNLESDGKAYEEKTVGAAQAEVIMLKEAAPLEGRAKGLAAMAAVLKDSPEAGEALAADTAREMMERANVIFAGGAESSLRDLMAGAKAVGEAMKTKPKEGADGRNS